jgi:hypothetical protein
MSQVGLALLLATLAGLSTTIGSAIAWLLPASRVFGQEHLTILGVLIGMLVIATSLALPA